MKRILLALVLTCAPIGVHAQEATSNGLQSTQSVASPQTSGLLQPAGGTSSPLQSADANSGGITQSPTQNLQQTGSSDQVQLFLQGEGEGAQEIEESANLTWLWYILLTLLVVTILTSVVWLLDRRGRSVVDETLPDQDEVAAVATETEAQQNDETLEGDTPLSDTSTATTPKKKTAKKAKSSKATKKRRR